MKNIQTGRSQWQSLRLSALAMGCLLWMGGAATGQTTAPADPATAPRYVNTSTWGLDALKQIRADFYLPSRHLYADTANAGQPASPDKPAFMWACGVQLSALAAAAPLDPTWKTRLLDYAQSLDRYWNKPNEDNAIGGYDVLPVPKPLDRYYDDNEWVVLAMAEGYDVTADPALKARAEQAMAFVLSGEDKRLGGGIYWRESDKKTKNTCSNAPAIVAALRLYQITRKPAYLVTARRLYIWTNAHLQDADGLYWDNMKLDGGLDKAKYSYNTALMLRANCLLYQETHEQPYLDEARRLARASEAQWVKPDTGAMADGGRFAHLLCEAFLYLSDVESSLKPTSKTPATTEPGADTKPAAIKPDPTRPLTSVPTTNPLLNATPDIAQDYTTHWRQLVRRALTYVHDHVRDPSGHYPDRWDANTTDPLAKYGLLEQASVARAYLMCGRY